VLLERYNCDARPPEGLPLARVSGSGTGPAAGFASTAGQRVWSSDQPDLDAVEEHERRHAHHPRRATVAAALLAHGFDIRLTGKADPREVLSLLYEAVSHCQNAKRMPAHVVCLKDSPILPHTCSALVHVSDDLTMFSGREDICREMHDALGDGGLQGWRRSMTSGSTRPRLRLPRLTADPAIG
jgi:hypothetical protein